MVSMNMTSAERAARADVTHWAQTVSTILNDIEMALPVVIAQRPGADGWTEGQQKLHSDFNSKVDMLLNAANHWYVSSEQVGLPKELRHTIKGELNVNLKVLVQHLRNIKEHWSSNRRYFDGSSQTVPESRDTRSVRWFKATYPNATPWSWSWDYIDGAKIAGTLNLNVLRDEVTTINKIVNEASVQ